jgi:hypothetical protein
MLGWTLNTRTLEIKLPAYKWLAWSKTLSDMIMKGTTNFEEMETVVGRLTHLAIVIQQVLHFLSRIRQLRDRAENRRIITIPEPVIQDFKLFIIVLNKAHTGISMNLLTFRRPTHVYRSDACPAGLGGYNHNGRAWRFYIPLHLQLRATLNFLERIACEIGPMIDLEEANLPPFSCTLSMTDSMVSQGWQRKSNFCETDETDIQIRLKREVSRDHAIIFMKNNIKDYSQWFPGSENDIADSLSRDFHIPTETLTQLYRSLIPEQMPEDFQIKPLPPGVKSWLGALLRQLPEATQGKEQHQKSKLVLGQDGRLSSNKLSTPKMNFSTTSNNINELTYSPVLPKLSGRQHISEALSIPWLQKQSEVPSTMWRRPLGTTVGKTRDWTRTERLQDFYNNSLQATKERIHQKSNKKQHQE